MPHESTVRVIGPSFSPRAPDTMTVNGPSLFNEQSIIDTSYKRMIGASYARAANTTGVLKPVAVPAQALMRAEAAVTSASALSIRPLDTTATAPIMRQLSVGLRNPFLPDSLDTAPVQPTHHLPIVPVPKAPAAPAQLAYPYLSPLQLFWYYHVRLQQFQALNATPSAQLDSDTLTPGQLSPAAPAKKKRASTKRRKAVKARPRPRRQRALKRQVKRSAHPVTLIKQVKQFEPETPAAMEATPSAAPVALSEPAASPHSTRDAKRRAEQQAMEAFAKRNKRKRYVPVRSE